MSEPRHFFFLSKRPLTRSLMEKRHWFVVFTGCVCFCWVVWSFMVGWFRFYDAFVSTDVSVRRQDCISQRLSWFGWAQSHFNWNQRSFILFFVIDYKVGGERGGGITWHGVTNEPIRYWNPYATSLYFQMSYLVRDAKFWKSNSENVNWIFPLKIKTRCIFFE